MALMPPKLTGKLLIDTAVGSFLDDERIRLLEAIDRLGSISQAAKTVPLSYKAAWDAVDDMNNVAPEPLVRRSAGGRHGGGTELTAFDRRPGLATGQNATAVFKASSVFLVATD